jgi:hypothetical protein
LTHNPKNNSNQLAPRTRGKPFQKKYNFTTITPNFPSSFFSIFGSSLLLEEETLGAACSGIALIVKVLR